MHDQKILQLRLETFYRESVTPANRFKIAQSLANFVNEHELDGVDIDWG